MAADDYTEAAMARTAAADIFGKLDAELPPIRINADTLADVHRAATDAGMGVTEFVRTLLYVRVYGLEHVLSLKESRIRRAMGNAEQMGSKAAGGAL